jgi:hypothetical protein
MDVLFERTSMRFVVEAWFHNSESDAVLEIVRSALTITGLSGLCTLAFQGENHSCVMLGQHEIFVSVSARTEGHLVATVRSWISWDEGYSAFEKMFVDMLDRRQHIGLAELFLSIRNSEPYPFLTHSFHRGSFPPTIIDLNNYETTRKGEETYWSEWGPELHFIADEVFERSGVDRTVFIHSLRAKVIDVAGGIVLDCGWTEELSLPQHITPSNNSLAQDR